MSQVCRSPSSLQDTFKYQYWKNNGTSFDVAVSDLKSVIIFHGRYIYAFQFTFLNGVVNTYGSITNGAIKNKTLIVLENSIITGVYMRLGSWVDSLQFKILNTETNTITLTPQLGGIGGFPVTYDKTTVAPSSSFFQITRLAGFVDGFLMDGFIDGFVLYSLFPSSSSITCLGLLIMLFFLFFL
jgi:hypothetical protein